MSLPTAATAADAVPGLSGSASERVLGASRRVRPSSPRERDATDGRHRLVVVGNGMAGARFVEEVLRRDTAGALRVTVLGQERHGNYNRILLPPLLAGERAEDDLVLNDHDWYADRGVTLRAGVRAQALDRTARRVVGSDGSSTGYDTLVLATGSRSHVPPMPGLRTAEGGLLPGAFAFRTLDDTRAIGAAARPGRHAVVLGGGLLGLEAARALQSRGLTVEVLHSGPHLMNTQLDAAAGAVLQRSVEALGIGVRLGVRAQDVVGDDRVRGVRLADGTTVPAEVLVLTAGVRPETALAASAGLAVARGVLVDDQLGTDDPHVRAIGECAEHRGRVYGLVGPVWEQAAVLAAVLTGADPLAEYLGSRTATKLKVAGLDVATMGAKEPEADDEHVVVSEPRRGVHLSAVIRGDRLVGATLIGDVRRAAALTQAYDRGTPLPTERVRLLVGATDAPAGDDVADLPADARVCHCNGVSKQDVCDAVAAGHGTLAALKSSTRAGTGCGSCTSSLTRLLDRAGAESRD